MRPSQKSGRSRGKNNRNRSVGHSPNRVYESAGPEGKVRGTPQQVIDKYLSLARDAQLSGDRVTAENFLQHAEHYARILIAMQEASGQDRREQQQQQQAQQPQPQPASEETEARAEDNAANGGEGEQPARSPARRRGRDQNNARKAEEETRREAPAAVEVESAEQPPSDGLAALNDAQNGPEIVETPESKAKPAERRPRRPRAKAVKAAPAAEGEASAEVAE